MERFFLRALAPVLVMGMSVAAPVRADDAIARQKLEEAQTSYEGRERLEKVDEALESLKVARTEAQDPALKLQIDALESRCWYYKGGQVEDNEQKKSLYQKGMDAASRIKQANDKLAEGFFLYSINLAQWGSANGVIASLARKAELISNLNGTIARTTADGQKGEAYDGWGANRVLGRLYFKLPGFAGGSHSRAVDLLTKAVENAPQHSGNFLYLAEVLLDGNESEKARAVELLNNSLARDPSTWDAKRAPETREDLRKMQALLDGI